MLNSVYLVTQINIENCLVIMLNSVYLVTQMLQSSIVGVELSIV
jgi:hypothetical protein